MRTSMSRSAILLAGVCMICAAAVAADTVIEEIIARINGAIITRSELIKSREQTIEEVKTKFGAGTAADEEQKKRDKDILRDMIDQQLLVQKAQELGIT